MHNAAGETICVAKSRSSSAGPRALGHFVSEGGVLVLGGMSGGGLGAVLLSAGVVPLSGVVLPVVAAPVGSVGGGLEPPQATATAQAQRARVKARKGRCIAPRSARCVPLARQWHLNCTC